MDSRLCGLTLVVGGGFSVREGLLQRMCQWTTGTEQGHGVLGQDFLSRRGQGHGVAVETARGVGAVEYRAAIAVVADAERSPVSVQRTGPTVPGSFATQGLKKVLVM